MLSEEDNLKVAQLTQLFPEIMTEIEAIENSLLQVSDETDAPADTVKEDLFAKLKTLPVSKAPDSSDVNTGRTIINDSREDGAVGKSEATILAMPQLSKRRNNGLFAASVIALVACAGIIAYLAGANNKFQDKANDLQAKVSNLQQRAQTQDQNLVLYQDTSYQKINLTHAPGKPDALAQIFWNRATQNVYVADISLPNAPAGKQYQLWAIVDGKPVNAGMINTKKTPQQMINFAKADAFAITLEKAGGSETPTLTSMYVLGKTS